MMIPSPEKRLRSRARISQTPPCFISPVSQETESLICHMRVHRTLWADPEEEAETTIAAAKKRTSEQCSNDFP